MHAQVTIPKEGATVVFAPSGIKTPARAQAASMGKPAIQVCDAARAGWN
jgi:staphylococcal nuclease domain-containing protein 1